MPHSFRKVYAGDEQLSAADWNRLCDVAERSEGVFGAQGFNQLKTAGGDAQSPGPPEWFLIQITSAPAAGTANYSAQEVQRGSDAIYRPFGGARTWTADKIPAVEMNGNRDIALNSIYPARYTADRQAVEFSVGISVCLKVLVDVACVNGQFQKTFKYIRFVGTISETPC